MSTILAIADDLVANMTELRRIAREQHAEKERLERQLNQLADVVQTESAPLLKGTLTSRAHQYVVEHGPSHVSVIASAIGTNKDSLGILLSNHVSRGRRGFIRVAPGTYKAEAR